MMKKIILIMLTRRRILTGRKISKTNEGKTHPPFVMRSNAYDQR